MDWRDLLDRAEDALGEQRHHDALQLCDRAAVHGDDARYYAGFLRGDVLLELGDVAAALSAYESVADPDIPDPELDCARGVALFELSKIPEAEAALRSAIRGAPDLAEAHYTLGLIAELRGSGEADELFRRARRLEPQRYTLPKPMSPAAFDEVVSAALDDLPPMVRDAIANVPVLIEELPDLEELVATQPPLSPSTLGLFVGAPPSSISVLDHVEVEQPAILLFKRNLERAFPDPELLREEIRVTVIHEVGHALGLSEDDLLERGLE
jgi:predicted Zn-dependent protease with MMP-like domain